MEVCVCFAFGRTGLSGPVHSNTDIFETACHIFLRNQLQMNERIHGLGVDKRLIRVKMSICTVSKVS